MRATVAAPKLAPSISSVVRHADRRAARRPSNVVARRTASSSLSMKMPTRDAIRTRATPTTTELTQLALAGIDTTGFDDRRHQRAQARHSVVLRRRRCDFHLWYDRKGGVSG
jgi:hypothetical protein